MKKIIYSLLFLSISSICLADSYEPNNYCSKPYKPSNFNSRYEMNTYLDEVEEYKQCLNDFIEEQNEGINNHKRAINDAILDWNDFVNYQLN